MNKIKPKVGDNVQPDLWKSWESLEPHGNLFDVSFPGCQFRLACKDCKLAVNIKVTGKPKFNGVTYQSRCRIEFVGDGEPSVFSGGLIYTERG